MVESSCQRQKILREAACVGHSTGLGAKGPVYTRSVLEQITHINQKFLYVKCLGHNSSQQLWHKFPAETQESKFMKMF